MIRKQLTGRILAFGAGAMALALGAAAPALATEGTAINGSGSALQAEAQQSIWTPGWESRTELTGSPTVTYHPTSNAEGLFEFGNFTGKLQPGPWGLDAFAGTDDSPTTGLIANAEKASGSTEITLPVAQEPVLVLLSLPQGVSGLEQGGTAATSVDLTNELLADAWQHEVPASASPAYAANTWGALLTDDGYTFTSTKKNGGTQRIELVSSVSGSGTDYAFKQYLSQLTPAYSAYANDFDSWPVSVSCGGFSSASEAQTVAATPGTIGYAYFIDASAAANGGFTSTPSPSTFGKSTSHLIAYALVQDNGAAPTGAVFAAPQKPGEEGGSEANVDLYYGIRTPNNFGKVGFWVDPEAANGSWAGTYASDPNVYNDSETHEAYYPIVAVTYDTAWGSYTTSQLASHYGGTANAQRVGNTTFDYLSYVLGHGQISVERDGRYAPDPTAPLYSASSHQLSAVNGGS